MKLLRCFGEMVYVSASSFAIEFSCSCRVKFSFPLTFFFMNFGVANFKEFWENRNQSKDGFVFRHSVSMEVSSFLFL